MKVRNRERKEDAIQIRGGKGPKYGRQLKRRHESQLKGPPKNAITTQLQKVRGQRHKNVSGYFFSFIT